MNTKKNKKFYKLSNREVDCLYYTIQGHSAKFIGQELSISHRTVESYLQNIKNKLDYHTKNELIDIALEQGWVQFLPIHIFKDIMKTWAQGNHI